MRDECKRAMGGKETRGGHSKSTRDALEVCALCWPPAASLLVYLVPALFIQKVAVRRFSVGSLRGAELLEIKK
jgi:hypothetical protein